MSDLIAFLRARLEEDQAKVAAIQRERTRVQTAPIFQAHPLGWLDSVDIFVSPDRWQAEIDAKRRIVAELERYRKWASEPCGREEGIDRDNHVDALTDVVQLLAVPYAGHPDFREEWRL